MVRKFNTGLGSAHSHPLLPTQLLQEGLICWCKPHSRANQRRKALAPAAAEPQRCTASKEVHAIMDQNDNFNGNRVARPLTLHRVDLHNMHTVSGFMPNRVTHAVHGVTLAEVWAPRAHLHLTAHGILGVLGQGDGLHLFQRSTGMDFSALWSMIQALCSQRAMMRFQGYQLGAQFLDHAQMAMPLPAGTGLNATLTPREVWRPQLKIAISMAKLERPLSNTLLGRCSFPQRLGAHGRKSEAVVEFRPRRLPLSAGQISEAAQPTHPTWCSVVQALTGCWSCFEGFLLR